MIEWRLVTALWTLMWIKIKNKKCWIICVPLLHIREKKTLQMHKIKPPIIYSADLLLKFAWIMNLTEYIDIFKTSLLVFIHLNIWLLFVWLYIHLTVFFLYTGCVTVCWDLIVNWLLLIWTTTPDMKQLLNLNIGKKTFHPQAS